MVSIRLARPDDADAVAEVHVRSWQIGYRGLLSDEYLDSLRSQERAARYTFGSTDPSAPTTLVALEGDAIRGFATFGPSPDTQIANPGELMALYVDPPAWRRGIGRDLIAEARRFLVERGFSEAVLWVLAGNERAERFYRADGWLPDGMRRTVAVWGVLVNESRYRRRL